MTKRLLFTTILFLIFLQTLLVPQAFAKANAGRDQRVNEGDKVFLDGSKSKPKGKDTIQSYLWKQVEVEGNPVTIKDADEVIASFIAPQVSKNTKLTFKLKVRFASGKEDNDDTKVYVLDRDDDDDDRDANDPPRADAGPNQNVDEETIVTLDGSNSFDPDDGINSHQWKQIAGPSVSLSNPQAVQSTFLAPNVEPKGLSFIFELTVTDYDSLQSTDTTIVNVIWLNDPPTANAGVDQAVLEKTTVTLDGSNSLDPDDGIKSYQWKQVAGQSVFLSDPTDDQPIFEAPSFDDSSDKPLIFELIVTDEGGLQSSDATNVTVSNFEKDNPGASGGGCFIDTAAYGFLNVFVMR